MVDRFPRVLAGQAWSESYRCLRAGRWPPPEIPSPAAALQATRLAAAPIAATDGAGALLGGMALSGLAGRAAAGSTGHPIGSAAAPAVGAAAAAVEDLATEANIFVIPAMDD